ncbi:MAG: hypothetical protein L0H70_06365, partial [Xanthomonadales bacterium]|nr:hypothetical protein [Xanthomonadales bacterium]
RVQILTYQRKYAAALTLLDAIPDTPDNFFLTTGQPKALQQADLYRLLGDTAKAQPLYQKALAALRPQLAKSEQTHNQYLAFVWVSVADAELGLGETEKGLAAIASAQAANAKLSRPLVRAYVAELNASLYVRARRPDLAVPLLAKALTMPAIGVNYSPALLWLDPAWDPIRHDPGFQALLQKYAKHKPAVIYPIPPAATSG